MGTSKAMMEKVIVAKSRTVDPKRQLYVLQDTEMLCVQEVLLYLCL